MPRATTAERSRPMKRTRNGILIPDVPIMAGGNLPNAVKGVSSGGGVNWRNTGAYIESISRYAQIDTLLTMREYRAELDIAFISNATNQNFFGHLVDDNRTYIRQSVYNAQHLDMEINNVEVAGYDIELNTRYLLEIKFYDNDVELYISGETPIQHNGTPTEGPIYLFNAWNPRGANHQLGSLIKVWSVKIWDKEGTLLREMYPAYLDNEVGMYDYVSQAYYFDSGTGEGGTAFRYGV